jgi:hypothetical protein
MRGYTKWTALIVVAIVAAGCASPKRGGPGGAQAVAPAGVNQPSQLLRQARDLQAKEGCEKAAPVYRIVSGYGEDYEVAQFELGACLLEMTGASDQETALFRQEALLWLNRAAWAGNPRAQGKLAEILSAAPRYSVLLVQSDPQQALVWSIVYDANSIRDTYGMKPTPALVSSHLQSSLSSAQQEAARNDAAKFRKIVMSGFVPTADKRDEEVDEQRRGSGPPPGGRRRPR